MKKILNSPDSYVDEMLEGMCQAHPDVYRRCGPQGRVMVRAHPASGKTGVVSGGGSGHLPLFTGYVGSGLLDAAAIGDVFASPTVDQICETIRQAHHGQGVLLLYGNYGGDVMNFDMAAEMVEPEGIHTATVLLADDVVSALPHEKEMRRGTGGLVYAFKIAGAAAHEGASLGETSRIAQKTADACRSVGMALTPCTVPQAGTPTFTIGDEDMEMGMGIHGEPGIRREKLKKADQIAQEMLELLLDDRPIGKTETVSVMINSLGATPPEELYIVYRCVNDILSGHDVRIDMPLVGRYATSMEMTGMTMTLCLLDDELRRLLHAPCNCAFWRV